MYSSLIWVLQNPAEGRSMHDVIALDLSKQQQMFSLPTPIASCGLGITLISLIVLYLVYIWCLVSSSTSLSWPRGNKPMQIPILMKRALFKERAEIWAVSLTTPPRRTNSSWTDLWLPHLAGNEEREGPWKVGRELLRVPAPCWAAGQRSWIKPHFTWKCM